MNGVLNFEEDDKVKIYRFYTPEHKNKFFKQFISYLFYSISTLKFAVKSRNEFDTIFATSSRLGTAFLGFLISKITSLPLSLDIRDVFSDNVKSLSFFKTYFGKIFVKIFSMTESLVLSHAKWLNFVSPGFNNYSHINVKRVNLFTNGIDSTFSLKRNI